MKELKKKKKKKKRDGKSCINSKETSKTDDNMIWKVSAVIDAIHFHVNKLAPENDISDRSS